MINAANQCEGKTRYTTSEAVHSAVANMNATGKVKVSSYKCPDCLGWHYGHAGRGKRMGPVKGKFRYENRN